MNYATPRRDFAAGAYGGLWHIAAPDVCDGMSAVGESRRRIQAHPLVNRLNLA